ncbi:hypothetical protein EDM56_03840 [Brevibacillus fluminis]|uniref:Uncharacterized protein n=1 Tax=Brevibacillus fluminis TaxID=511487 RepID=A0A3M8DUM4_9BACL|nr:hypothetical protein [Brevibacillus fluminis]RNB91893.1 hypothetical protein EDM56_03840 [Brevibacillus fluminis]
MRACLHAWTMFLAILACSISAGCSEVTTKPVTDNDSHATSKIQEQFGTIDKVSVMTTDGQEIFLDKKEFMQNAEKMAAFLPQELEKVKTDDARFTLIVYRSQSAPFVLEIGPGSEAMNVLYHWIRKETAEVVFQQIHIRTLELSATDLDQHYIPTDEETAKINKLLTSATFSETTEPLQYSLYPGYQLVINTPERAIAARLLSPSLIGLSLGKEHLFYTVSTDLFSAVANWLPPEKEGVRDVFDPLLQATKVILAPTGEGMSDTLTYDPAESSRYMGLLHETVRELKRAHPLSTPSPTTSPAYYLRVMTGNTEHTIRVYGDTFRYEGKMYQQSKLQELLRDYRQIISK